MTTPAGKPAKLEAELTALRTALRFLMRCEGEWTWRDFKDQWLIPAIAQLEVEAAQSQMPEPSGYAYRYADGIRFNEGQMVNGGKPIEAIPYFLGQPAPAAAARPEGDTK